MCIVFQFNDATALISALIRDNVTTLVTYVFWIFFSDSSPDFHYTICCATYIFNKSLASSLCTQTYIMVKRTRKIKTCPISFLFLSSVSQRKLRTDQPFSSQHGSTVIYFSMATFVFVSYSVFFLQTDYQGKK